MTAIEQDHLCARRVDQWKALQDSYDGQTCPKCGYETMPDPRDSTVHYCPTCGWRYYPRVNVADEIRGHTKKTKSANMYNRTYGEYKCPCGETFLRKSPIQEFHTKKCRAEHKVEIGVRNG